MRVAERKGEVVRGQGSLELVGVLADAQRDVFHGRPDDAVAALERVVQEGLSPADSASATWLLGVCHGAAGRYGAAIQALEPLADAVSSAGADPRAETVSPADAPSPAGDQRGERQHGDALASRMQAAFACSTLAALHRQLGRHAVARSWDERGLRVSSGDDEAAFDCCLGLAADAVGLGERREAGRLLARAEEIANGRRSWWRAPVRLRWVRAEVALAEHDPIRAEDAAAEAVALAEDASAPRHVAKGLLMQGVARIERGRRYDAPPLLTRAVALAESLGVQPLAWRGRTVLAALAAPTDPADAAAHLDAAARAVREICAGLPAPLRAEWASRPDVAAVLAACRTA